MEYCCRRVLCPYCGHIFMWINEPDEGSQCYVYTDRQSGESCLSAKCPECGRRMIVRQNELSGRDLNDDGFKPSVVRGI